MNFKPLWMVTQTLSSVAMGRIPADLIIKNAKLVNVLTREIQEGIDVAIAAGRIALVGDASHCVGENTRIIDAGGQYIAPGFLDGHVHVESSMLTVGEYAKAVIPHGTVGIYMDPHEIANVMGFDGVEIMLEDGKRTPLKVMSCMPSCVPAVPGFEDTGAAIGPADVRLAMERDDIYALGEMMNFPGILSSTDHAHGEVQETLRANKIVTGHYSLPDTGAGLNAYIASGVTSCHESTRAVDALEKMRRGMYAMIREGSAWHDLAEVSKAITQNKVDSRYALLVSDDTHPHTVVTSGHLDHILRRALEEGIDVLTAIQMVTINVAQSFEMQRDLGSIAPSKCADIVFLKDLASLEVTRVLINGEVVAENGEMTVDFAPYAYPARATHTMHLARPVSPGDFAIKAPDSPSLARVIEVIAERVGTIERRLEVPIVGGEAFADADNDILKAAVIERHKQTGTIGLGFVRGFGIKEGAMASTVAHDAHNVLVVGTNDEDMALAANTLAQCGGGMVTVRGGKVLGLVELPVAGLMAEEAAAVMADKVGKLELTWKDLGCTMHSPFMTMALLALACLPELRLTNRGLVDCNVFAFVDLFTPKNA